MGQLQHPVAFIAYKFGARQSSDFLPFPICASSESHPIIPLGLRRDTRSGFCTLLCDKFDTFPKPVNVSNNDRYPINVRK